MYWPVFTIFKLAMLIGFDVIVCYFTFTKKIQSEQLHKKYLVLTLKVLTKKSICYLCQS